MPSKEDDAATRMLARPAHLSNTAVDKADAEKRDRNRRNFYESDHFLKVKIPAQQHLLTACLITSTSPLYPLIIML